MSDRSPQRIKLTDVSIKKADWDMRSSRVQMITGLSIGSVALAGLALLAAQLGIGATVEPTWLVKGSPATPLSGLVAPYAMSLERNFFSHLSGYSWQSLKLIIHITSGITLALIALDISNRFGERTGAAPGVWAGLLFLAYPVAADMICLGSATRSMLPLLASLVALYADLRYRLLGETFYLFLTIASINLAALLNPGAMLIGLLGILLARAFLPDQGADDMSPSISSSLPALLSITSIPLALSLPRLLTGAGRLEASPVELVLTLLMPETPSRPELYLICSSIAMACSLVFLRWLAGSVWIRPLAFAVLWASLSLCVLLPFAPGTGMALYVLAAPLVFLTTTLALPSIDAIGKRATLALIPLGCTSLSFLLIVWAVWSLERVQADQKASASLTTYLDGVKKQCGRLEGDLVFVGLPTELSEMASRKRNRGAARLTPLSGKEDLDDFIFDTASGAAGDGAGSIAMITGLSEMPTGDTRALASESAAIYRWGDSGLQEISYSGARSFSFVASKSARSLLRLQSPGSIVSSSELAAVSPRDPFVEVATDRIRIVPGYKSRLRLLLPVGKLNPRLVRKITLETGTSGMVTEPVKIALAWTGKSGKDFARELTYTGSGRYEVRTGQLPDWLGQESIVSLALTAEPGNYSFEFDRIYSSES